MYKNGLMRSYFYKIATSPLSALGIIGAAAVCFIRFLSGWTSATVSGEFDLMLTLDSSRKLIAIFAALPFAANFAEEWNNSSTILISTRCGERKYIFANVSCVFISSTLVAFLGTMIFAVALSFFMPVYIDDGNPLFPPYGELLTTDFPMLHIITEAFVFAVSCAVWSEAGLMLSAFFPNKYVAMLSPFVASYIVERITLQFPAPLNLWYLSISVLAWDNALAQFFYTIGVFVLLSAVCGTVFWIVVRRRIRNEIV